MPDTYVQLPDKSYVHIPEGTSPDKLQEFRNHLASQFADLKTGAGMQQRAEEQATASLPKPDTTSAMRRGEPIGEKIQTPVQRAEHVNELEHYIAPGALALSGGEPLIAGGAEALAASSLKPLIRAAVPYAASYLGSEAGKRVAGTPGEIIGGIAGMAAPGAFRPLFSRVLTPEAVETMLGPRAAKTPTKLPNTFTIPAKVPERQAAIPRMASPEQAASFAAPYKVPTPEPEGLTIAKPVPQAGIPNAASPTPSVSFTAPYKTPQADKVASLPDSGERVAGTRSLIKTPEEARSDDVLQRISKNQAKVRGTYFAGGMAPPEGRSVPRYSNKVAMPEWSGVKERVSLIPSPEEYLAPRPDEEDEGQNIAAD